MTTQTLSVREQAERLIERVGPTAASLALNLSRQLSLDAVRSNDEFGLEEHQQARLEKSLELLDKVGHFEDEHPTRQWFIGGNVHIPTEGVDAETVSPAEAIRHGYFDEATVSAERVIHDSWSF